MILGHQDQCDEIVESLPERFHRGMQFLQSNELLKLDAGKHVIDGDDLFAIVADDLGRGKEDSPLECHRAHADIQYVVSGVDVIGWRPLVLCRHPREEFDAERDLGFFTDRPTTWLTVPEQHFAIFFPDDAHAPLANTGPVRKVVVKVRLD